jgi:hypothetical protein
MNIVIFYQVIELFLLPAIVPWAFIGINLQNYVLYFGLEESFQMTNPIFESVLFNILTISGSLGYLIYEVFKRRANRIIYNRKNEGIWRII